MKSKSARCSTGHGTGTTMPESTSWPPPPSPSSTFIGGVHRSQVETLRVLKVTNAKLGDYAEAMRKDRNEKRAQLERNRQRIRELETEKLVLENAARRNVGARVKAAMSRLFGVGKRGKR